MTRKKRRHRGRGRFCWSCERILANERFRSKGDSHLCNDCRKLPQEELSYRQEVRNIDRLLHDGVFIRRKQRKVFERFLTHENERIRAYAQEVAEQDRRERADFAEMRALDDVDWEDEEVPF